MKRKAPNNETKKIIEILRSLKEEIKEKYKAEIIGIFGSYVRGKQKKSSDLDVLVRFSKGATLIDFVGLALFLEKKLGIKEVDIVPEDAVRPELKDRISKEAIYI
ncbi:MAG: nucleotidyltransferase family protein [Caldimicrobium sp.]